MYTRERRPCVNDVFQLVRGGEGGGATRALQRRVRKRLVSIFVAPASHISHLSSTGDSRIRASCVGPTMNVSIPEKSRRCWWSPCATRFCFCCASSFFSFFLHQNASRHRVHAPSPSTHAPPLPSPPPTRTDRCSTSTPTPRTGGRLSMSFTIVSAQTVGAGNIHSLYEEHRSATPATERNTD